jgi:gluconate 2-dehydrogenase subunit 3-like protein
MAQEPPARSRRDFIKHGVLLASVAAGASVLTPAASRAARAPYRVFDPTHVRTLESLGDILVPGSAREGLAHYIDAQLSGPSIDSLLMIKYLGVNPPFTDFYRSGLDALNDAARRIHSLPFSSLAAPDAGALVSAMATGDIPGWSGPPAPLVFFVLRNDAVDVVYGTVSGFESLGVPYMPHIAPPTRWGA